MTDTRELILARLVSVLEAAQSGLTVLRNVPLTDPDTRPVVVVYDGDEEADPSDPNKEGVRSRRRMRMTPTVGFLASGPAATIGTSMNTLRALLIYEVMTDNTLAALTINNNGPSYEGAQQLVEEGRRIDGAMLLQFAFRYDFRLSDLA